MIIDILKYLNDGGTFSISAIAKNLNISDDMAKEYREKLIKFNYIRKVNSCSSEMCSKCACGCSSKTLSNLETWEITEKGFKVINIS